MTDDTIRTPQVSQFPFGADGESWQQMLDSHGLSNGQISLVSGPTGDPQSMYPVEPGLTTRDFEIPIGGLSHANRRKALSSIELYLAERRDHMLGYQANQDMNGYPTDLSRFMEGHLNNIGDPFQSGGYKPNTKVVERAVLDYYAALWHAKWPHNPADPESYWGYMLSMGSTEGNMYALWNARDYLGGKALLSSDQPGPFGAMRFVQAAPHVDNPNAFKPVAFYSEDTHYSLAKAVRVMGVDTFHAAGEAMYRGRCPLKDADGNPLAHWPTEVPSRRGPSGHSADGPGDIDIDALETLVRFFAGNGHPIMIVLNYGSTFKGAHDDVRKVCERLLPIFEDNGLVDRRVHYGKDPKTGEDLVDFRRGFWIHVDGALGAGYGPFQRMAYRDPRFGWTPEVNLPEFDFGLKMSSKSHGEIDMVCSIAIERSQVARRSMAVRSVHDQGQIPADATVAPGVHRLPRHHLRRLPQRLLAPGPLGPPGPPLLPGPRQHATYGTGAGGLPRRAVARPGEEARRAAVAGPHARCPHRPLPPPQRPTGGEVVIVNGGPAHEAWQTGDCAPLRAHLHDDFCHAREDRCLPHRSRP
ncbi:hypothetical protein J7I98_37345 [Streptomyces sp. ISL-98]|uniref:hypothetical protein n=1 Tax=Streptomyces sp. ISL-98 TaxID=2819192 RepID=UPI001BE6543F|nr:hypothetical protein [Streptomyces sp. ISL-98]MBT2511382.1 hypothetical protein [Streptomyces sp. ISL-98]